MLSFQLKKKKRKKNIREELQKVWGQQSGQPSVLC